MINIEPKEKCCGCGVCSNICPKQCITLAEDNEGFKYPVIDTKSCIDCHLCEHVCPFNLEQPPRESKPKTYVSYSKNEILRKSSSSGGLFSELANLFLKNDGVVYGAAMSEDVLSASHIRVENCEGLAKLKGSKYIQSNTSNVFKDVKADLIKNRLVLFSGTPCQIDALKLFLGKPYDNLLMVEVICHGVPSPKLWRKYIEYLEKKNKGKIKAVNFRDKANGWKRFGLSKKWENNSQILDLHNDPYIVMFLRNCCLRPSCYNCNSKKHESNADITLADAWGVTDYAPEFDDDKGTSLVLIQTEKGERYFSTLNDRIVEKQVDFISAINSNKSYYLSTDRPVTRDSFFIDAERLSFEKLKNKYCRHTPFSLRVKRFLAKTFVWKALKKFIRKDKK